MANKNIKVTTDEYKLIGTLNSDRIKEGIIVLESDSEKRLDEYIDSFNGDEIEISIKRKIEQVL